MPYVSKAQQGLFHSPNSPVSPAEVKKWDRESKGERHLPGHVKKGGHKSHARAKAMAAERDR